MLIYFFILFVCYMPIFGVFMPKVLGDISLSWFVFYVLLLVFLVSSATKGKLEVKSMYLFFLFFFSWIVFASIAWSDYRMYNLFLMKRMFARLFVPFTVAFIALNVFDDVKNRERFVKHLCWAAFFLAMTAAYQMIFGQATIEDDNLRASATFENANGLAIFLVLTIPTMLFGLMEKIMKRKILLPVFIGVILGIICTASRKGIITMGIATLIYLWLMKQYKYVVIGFAILTVLGIGIVGYSGLSQRFEAEEMGSELAGRWGVIRIGLQMVADKPFLGHGYDGFKNNVKKYVPGAKRSLDSHNIFISAFVAYGLIGMVSFMALFVYPLSKAVRLLMKTRRLMQPDIEKHMAAICLVCVLMFMLNGWFAGGLFNQWPILNLYYAIIMMFFASTKAPKSSVYPLASTAP